MTPERITLRGYSDNDGGFDAAHLDLNESHGLPFAIVAEPKERTYKGQDDEWDEAREEAFVAAVIEWAKEAVADLDEEPESAILVLDPGRDQVREIAIPKVSE